MLEFLRRYQKVLFLVVTVMVISSFVFFGTYSAFDNRAEVPDRSLTKMVGGSSMMMSEVQKLSRFIATDREDSWQNRGAAPNFCNDGVIRYDFIKDGLAHLIVENYFDRLKGDFETRLERAKRFKGYAHPQLPVLSAKAVWDHFIPDCLVEVGALQAEPAANLAVFSHLEKLYQYQSHLKPEMLRQILTYQQRQYSGLTPDPRLPYEDLSLFGFHSAGDWFGPNFVDLISQFILNVAAIAEEKGYKVTAQEAKGDLIHCFQETIDKLKEANQKPNIHFQAHLQTLGFDEKSAVETWRKVLLFRKYYQDVGEAAFVDRLPFKDFAGYAKESAIVQVYRPAIQLSSAQDVAELQFYIKAISQEVKNGLPVSLLSVEQVEKKVPELVQKTVRASVAEVSKKQLASRPSVKQVWDWELDNWEKLSQKFALPKKEGREERFKALEESPKRGEIDAWARLNLVDANPSWLEEALAAATVQERTWNVAANETPSLKDEGMYYRIEDQQIVQDKHILTFQEARAALAKLVGKAEGEFDKDKNPFAGFCKVALASLQKGGSDTPWIQSGDGLLDQFKLAKKEESIERASKENWMKEQAFMIMPELWSPIYVAESGEIVFFYLQEKKVQPAPILDQLSLGKEMLAADAKVFATESLLKVVKQKNAIVIPIQKEDE